MTKNPGDILLRRYLKGHSTEAEQKKIERWLQEDPSHADRLERFVEKHTGQVEVEVDSVKTELLKSIEDAASNRSDSPSPNREMTRTSGGRGSWIAAAATILLILSASVGGYLIFTDTPASESEYIERTIPPGKVATITLSDGSKVQLNSASTLRFPKQFSSTVRKVYLSGEAFFEVRSDKDRPFKVYAGNVRTTVLGTAFNVRAFPEENQARVTVAEGRVSVDVITSEEDSSSTTMLLQPNQWATYSDSGKQLQKGQGEIRELIAWKDGILIFDNKTLSEAIDIMERWYGTEITLKNEALKDCVLHGEYKDENLENVLEAIEYALGIHYSLTDKGVVISGGGCK